MLSVPASWSHCTKRLFSSIRPQHGRPRWGLFGDVHFQQRGLPRIQETAQWLTSEMSRRGVTKVVCLGDVLNTREMVNVEALSAAMKMFESLAAEFEEVHVILGNHDVSRRHISSVSSLDGLNLSSIHLHRDPTAFSMDGVSVLMLPWQELGGIAKELQSRAEVTADTVVFAHVALAGARASIASPGRVPSPLTSSDFAGVRRAFSGHLHVHQTVGRVTFVGAPLQHHFGDAGDVTRGFGIYDPLSDSYEHVVNPHADVFRRLHERDVGEGVLQRMEGKHVLVDVESTSPDHSSAPARFAALKEALLAAGAASVRRRVVGAAPAPTQPAIPESPRSTSLPDSLERYLDAVLAQDGKEPAEVSATTRTELLQRGRDFLRGRQEQGHTATSAFRANLRSVTMQNFLGVRGPLTVPLHAYPPGVLRVAGPNGVGKSTVLEAVTWAQFDRFLRSDMRASFAINDKAGKDCLVRLEFASGWTIERFRNYKLMGGTGCRVHKDGVYQSHLERGDARSTQAAVEDVLGVSFDAFAVSVVLGDGACASFAAASPLARRALLERVLGLDVLDDALERCRAARREQDGAVLAAEEEERLALSQAEAEVARAAALLERATAAGDERASLLRRCKAQPESLAWAERVASRGHLSLLDHARALASPHPAPPPPLQPGFSSSWKPTIADGRAVLSGLVPALKERFSGLHAAAVLLDALVALRPPVAGEERSTEAPVTTSVEYLAGVHASWSAAAKEAERAAARSRKDAQAALVRAKEAARVREPTLFWEKAFDRRARRKGDAPTLRAFLLEESVSELNAVLSQFSDQLGDTHPRLAFDGDLALVGDRGKLSAGQRRRAELALLLALAQVVRLHSPYRADFLMVDELLDALDEEGRGAAEDMLVRLGHAIPRVVLVSHAPASANAAYVGELRVSLGDDGGTRFDDGRGTDFTTPNEEMPPGR